MTTHPVVRVLHDVGLATFTGGSLMGAVGLNGAAATVSDPAERARVSTAGWSRWAPVGAAGLAAHLVGAAGLTVTDWPRVRSQQGVAASSAAKAVATGLAVGLGAWDAVLNRRMAASVPVPVEGATEPSAQTPPDVAATLRRLKALQWVNPVVGLAVLAIGAYQSEQQRAAQEAKGRLQRALPSVDAVPLAVTAAAVGAGLLAARRRRRRPAEVVEVVEVVELVDVSLGDSDTAGIASL